MECQRRRRPDCPVPVCAYVCVCVFIIQCSSTVVARRNRVKRGRGNQTDGIRIMIVMCTYKGGNYYNIIAYNAPSYVVRRSGFCEVQWRDYTARAYEKKMGKKTVSLSLRASGPYRIRGKTNETCAWPYALVGTHKIRKYTRARARVRARVCVCTIQYYYYYYTRTRIPVYVFFIFSLYVYIYI